MAEIFISYSHKDWGEVEGVIRFLESKGITCRYDRKDYPVGPSIDKSFEDIAPHCDYLLLLISKNSCESREIKLEYDDARSWVRYGKFKLKAIISVRLDDYEYQPKFPGLVRDHYIDLQKGENREDELRKLVDTIISSETEPDEIPKVAENFYSDKLGFRLRTMRRYAHVPIIGRHPGIAEITMLVLDEKTGKDEEFAFLLNLGRPQDSGWFKAIHPLWSAAFESDNFKGKGKNPYTADRDKFSELVKESWQSAGMLTSIGEAFPPELESIIISASFARDFSVDADDEPLSKEQFHNRMKAILDEDAGRRKIKACDAMFGPAGDKFVEFSNDFLLPIATTEDKYISAINVMMPHLQ